MNVKIINGSALSELKKLENESVNCVMTSPPYWALRDYGKSVESVWDGKEDCEHDFDIIERQLHSGTLDVTKTVHHALKVGALKTDWKTEDGFCIKCGAWKGQLGLEPDFDLYIKHLCDIFDEVKRVLRKDGTCWVNLGDTYFTKSGTSFFDDNLTHNKHLDGNKGLFGEVKNTNKEEVTRGTGINKANELRDYGVLPSKSLTMIPFRFAIEMVNRGWILRNTIIWHKRNCMPSSVKDRFTVDFEYIFFFTKSKKYYFETQYEPLNKESIKRSKRAWSGKDKNTLGNPMGAIRHDEKPYGVENKRMYNIELGRNKRAVWTINPKPFKEAHFATFPEALCETPIKAGCPEFVCVKCGKARKKIIEIISGKGEGKPYDANRPDGYIMNGRNRKSQHNFKGLTNCGCNAGFHGGTVLDPFTGSGTTALVALKQNKKFIGIELNPEYIKIALKRLKPLIEQRRLI